MVQYNFMWVVVSKRSVLITKLHEMSDLRNKLTQVDVKVQTRNVF